ncbi:unnamed protein product [Chondrus crispus]|uniref:Uncharacterized protein n=1 Tax=Chondrus crispus TaxID=2769 RepID=R7QHB5_CHOCR|nr:unnamed protein product [Chondrus crispus]CDF37912.1 unnamed protein product [Chondrus crispus]|eukprot:XP_005717783.1 unnamed protein product [Chondrus crispus]
MVMPSRVCVCPPVTTERRRQRFILIQGVSCEGVGEWILTPSREGFRFPIVASERPKG